MRRRELHLSTKVPKRNGSAGDEKLQVPLKWSGGRHRGVGAVGRGCCSCGQCLCVTATARPAGPCLGWMRLCGLCAPSEAMLRSLVAIAARRKLSTGRVVAPPTLLLGDERLRRTSADCDFSDPQLLHTEAELHAALARFRDENGYGRAMSAPQINRHVRMIACDLGEDADWPQPFTLCNPMLVASSAATFSMWDDCMSFPDLMVRLRRAESISLRYWDARGREQSWLDLRRQESELMQHEVSVLLPDKHHPHCTRALSPAAARLRPLVDAPLRRRVCAARPSRRHPLRRPRRRPRRRHRPACELPAPARELRCARRLCHRADGDLVEYSRLCHTRGGPGAPSRIGTLTVTAEVEPVTKGQNTAACALQPAVTAATTQRF